MRNPRLLLAGAIGLAALGASVVLTVTASADTATYEAEAAVNTLTGRARVATCGACSGGRKVGYVGNNAGTLQFNGVTAETAGPATVTITYTSGGVRSARLSVNGGASRTISFPGTGGFGTPGTLDTTVTLRSGTNTLRFSNPNGWAPDFDRITVVSGPAPTPTPTVPPTQSPTPRPTPSGNAGLEAEVVVLVNEERARAGCQPLEADSRLTDAARGHSADMAARNYFSHTTPEGVSFADRITRAGYRWSGAAENIAKGQRTPGAVMDSWMNSAGHRANILNCGYRHIGVGLAYDSRNTPLWTQDFASPR